MRRLTTLLLRPIVREVVREELNRPIAEAFADERGSGLRLLPSGEKVYLSSDTAQALGVDAE
jgi:hypothetical protein